MNDRFPFRAAIFDLDGTVLDSMGVWKDVDERFFAERGIAMPEDYSRAIQGKSFLECAEYTRERFGLPESLEAMMEVWKRMSMDEYAHHVVLKPGARDYLRALRRAGVKLAVATANRREVFMPSLERNGIAELFDAVCTAGEVGDRGKGDGVLFTHAARRLGVAPSECAVFEDTYEGIAGARRAGMAAWAVRDAASEHDLARIAALADGVIDDYADMPRPDNRRRCVIFTAYCEGDPAAAYAPAPGDLVLCADGGWRLARAAGVEPDAALGDFDSSEVPEGVEVTRFPVEKDDTDTLLCLKRGLSMGFDDFLIVGGFGGRVDHMLANFQALHYAAARFARAEMADGRRWATVVMNGKITVPARPGHLSVFALDSECRGVRISGTKYVADDATLTNRFPLGVSNAFAGDAAEIAVREGALLVMTCEA